MLNHIDIAGRMVRDPEAKTTTTGTAVTTVTLACDRDYNPGGDRTADFIDIVSYRKTAEFIANYGSKGRMLIVSGRLQRREYETKDGSKRQVYEVIADNAYFADKAPTAPVPRPVAVDDTYTIYGTENTQSAFREFEDDDGELPF